MARKDTAVTPVSLLFTFCNYMLYVYICLLLCLLRSISTAPINMDGNHQGRYLCSGTNMQTTWNIFILFVHIFCGRMLGDMTIDILSQ